MLGVNLQGDRNGKSCEDQLALAASVAEQQEACHVAAISSAVRALWESYGSIRNLLDFLDYFKIF